MNRNFRFMFNRIETGNINQQLRRLVDMDLVNFYVLGKVSSINQVLEAANAEKYFGKRFAWYAITREPTGEPSIKADNASIVFSNPTINADSAAGPLFKASGLNPINVDTGFYFDLILRAVTAVKYIYRNNRTMIDRSVNCRYLKTGT